MAIQTAPPTLRLLPPVPAATDAATDEGSTSKRERAVARIRDLARLSPDARRLRNDVARWAVATGRPLDYDALSLVLAVKAESRRPVDHWTEDDVWQLWWLDLFAWCLRRGVDTPVTVGGAMVTLFGYLDASGGFAIGSDNAEQLEAALRSAGGSTPRRLPRPAG